MSTPIIITPKHKAIETYYRKRQEIEAQGVTHELAVREAFKGLLESVGALQKWTLVVEDRVAGMKKVVRPDGTLKDEYRLAHGYWEAKDSKDNLDTEIIKKFERGYPNSNIIFEDTRRAVLYQNGKRIGDYTLNDAGELADLLTRFISYTEPLIDEFHVAVEKFKADTKRHAEGVEDLIREAHRSNRAFQTAYTEFFELCKTALNPNISRDAVDEMLIQHLLTERLMRTVLDNPDFVSRNVIATEVEKVINALTSKSFSRKEFLGKFDYFYTAIEGASRHLPDFSERQAFINTVYERFFQGYAVKVADTHGIVYTPQPIVDFMCAAVEEVLRDEFNLGLADEEVCIIDPATGTGNFIINLLHRIHSSAPHRLPEVYQKRLFANEVMLLPYYVASLNIEHAYYELTKTYEPFEGLCFVDTLDLAEGTQTTFAFMNQKNTERVERQQQAPITVIIGNPPYNVGQLNENDNNKNRKYPVIDEHIRQTYTKDSRATNRNALSDVYVKFFRWASDRLQGRDGIVCYVSNNSFVDGIAFDGMRKHLLQDFTTIYHLDLSGNARTSGERRRIEGGNVFLDQIRVGVGITIAIRSANHTEKRLFYYRIPDYWKAEQKLNFLRKNVEIRGRENSLNSMEWQKLTPNSKHFWRSAQNTDEFSMLIALGDKKSKSTAVQNVETIFKSYSRGLETTRDNWVYDFDRSNLIVKVTETIETYNSEVDRWRRAGKPQNIDGFVTYDMTKIKWSSRLKETLVREMYASYSIDRIRTSLYRPYSKQFVYFDSILNHRQGQFPYIFPLPLKEQENKVICVPGIGSNKPPQVLMTTHIPCLDILEKTQCFPFYVYDEDGSNRRENITDWALKEFQEQYGDDSISKWDIFYYVYGLLHHPEYRTRYADNLKRELPRIPYAPDFGVFAQAGRELAELHLNYETVAPYKLDYEWKASRPVTYEVKKMSLSKDKTALTVNGSLTLRGIPAEAFAYRLGNRSALDWVIDQYRVKEDKRSGIRSDPNLYSDDPRYIVDLVGRVIAVSVETVRVVGGLPSLSLDN